MKKREDQQKMEQREVEQELSSLLERTFRLEDELNAIAKLE
ncbi:MAG TPA: hypothetical protein VJ912_00395 [Candidatus Nanoarchaeia archaeon]|nr:hypothetical protein [Candidatus Nanoarchaeia archaeon]